jgi:tetraacyldisaccharide 4'-kinase
MTPSRTTAWALALRQSWTKRGVLAWTLLPLALIYGLLLRCRKGLYRLGWRATERVTVPVVVVGNVVVGGAGKTPVVMALIEHWQARGLKVGVISRGYGRRSSGCLEVTAHTDANQVGDEPSLIYQRTQSPTFVAERRIDAARALLAAHPATQLIISDDGLQHVALHRDLEIGVFDDRGVGNGWLLPAGPLREPWPRPLDLVLHSGAHPAFEGYVAVRALQLVAHRADGLSMRLSELAQLSEQPLLALAAIAQPEAFFAMLRTQGLTRFDTLALPDHYNFDSFNQTKYKGYRLICTEKDAVKLWPLRPDALAVPLRCTLPDALWRELDQRIDALLAAAPNHPPCI